MEQIVADILAACDIAVDNAQDLHYREAQEHMIIVRGGLRLLQRCLSGDADPEDWSFIYSILAGVGE